MEEMQQHNMSWIEVQFLQKAVDILCDCRRTLMFTYVFAYYLRKNNQCDIFEVSQSQDLNQFSLGKTYPRNACFEHTTLPSVMNAKPGQQRVLSCHENGFIKMILFYGVFSLSKLNAPHERDLENHVQGRSLCSGRLHFSKPTLKLVKKIILSIPPINSKTKSLQENQKDLETATETLSEYLERDISAENLVDIKQKVQDKYR